MMRRIFFLVVIALLFISMTLSGCNNKEASTSSSTISPSSALPSTSVEEEPADFGIYLVDSGELVLSDQDIQAYYKDTHTIELNEKGIERWNSFQTYTGIPQLNDTLFSKDFVVKLEDREMYRGKFWSMASSASYSGIIIVESLFKLDSDNNAIRIEFGYPSPEFGVGQDPRDNPEIISFFEERGLLK